METSERFEGLSAAEMTTLKGKRQSAILMLIAVNGMLMVVGAWAVWRSSWLFIVAFLLITPILVLLLLQRELRSILALNRDIRDGKKKVVVDHVESQRQDITQSGGSGGSATSYVIDGESSMSYSYLIKVQGKEIKVSESQYYKCEPGQLVELHLAPHSDHLFSFKVLKEYVPEVNPQTASA